MIHKTESAGPDRQPTNTTMHHDPSAVGVVQWVIPTRPRRLPIQSTVQNKQRAQTRNSHESAKSENFFNPDSDAKSINSNTTVSPDSPVSLQLDSCILRTISAFVQGHLKELEEHQRLISKARSNIANNNTSKAQLDYEALGARLDVTKLKVRDEQTKAIETIKQLTNYYRELTYLIKQCDSQKDKVDENIINKLSELRSEIIQAVNDFVLANSDIDLPILEFDDSDYDYCIGAREALLDKDNATRQARLAASHGDSIDESFVDLEDTNLAPEHHQQQQLVTTIDDQSIVLEKRRREIQKIERDTEELKRLFTDFYTLVKAQGEQVDSIENNIVIATHRISEGHRNVNKTMKSLTIIMPVTGCMAGALIGGPLGLAIGGKMGGITVGCVTSLLGFLSSYSAHRCIVANRIKDD